MSIDSHPQKFFFPIASISGLLLIILAFLANSALDLGAPDASAASAQCLKYLQYFNTLTLLSSVVLLYVSNLIYKNDRKGIWFLFTWLFFTLFTLTEYLWLYGQHFQFVKQAGIWSGGFEVGFLVGFFKAIAAAVVCGLNYFIVKSRAK